jgi:hypothetical protein
MWTEGQALEESSVVDNWWSRDGWTCWAIDTVLFVCLRLVVVVGVVVVVWIRSVRFGYKIWLVGGMLRSE